VVPVLAAAGAFGLLLAAVELFHARGLSSESTRRLAHITGSSIAVPVQWLLTLPQLAVLAVAFGAILLGTRVTGRLQSVHGVSRATVGAQLLPVGLLLAVFVAGGHHLAAAFGMLVCAFADPMAGFVGRVGGPSWHIPGGSKSLVGSAAFFGTTMSLCLIFGIVTATDPLVAWLAAALALTVLEACSGFGLDNLFVPVAGALTGRAWLGL
jgi:dolichol kinase